MHLLDALHHPLRHAVAERTAQDAAQRARQILGGIPAQAAGQRGYGIGQLGVALDAHVLHRSRLPAAGDVRRHQWPLLQGHGQRHVRAFVRLRQFRQALPCHLQCERERGGVEADDTTGEGLEHADGPGFLFQQVVEGCDGRLGQGGWEGGHGWVRLGAGLSGDGWFGWF